VDLLKAALLVPHGDEEATQATVYIEVEDRRVQTNTPVGRGIGVRVLQPNKNVDSQNPPEDPRYFLLSAAHVLIEIAKLMTNAEPGSCHLLLSKLGQRISASYSQKERPGTRILHLDYVSKGTNDYGLMELDDNSLPEGVMVKSLHFLPPKVGQSVVAYGKAYLEGIVTDVADDEGRFSVTAHYTRPGSSDGAPVFNNNCHLVGVVHGSTKHRRAHVVARSCECDDDSAIVYADTFILVTEEEEESLFQIHQEHWKSLNDVEHLSPEVLSGEIKLANIDKKENPGTERVWDLIRDDLYFEPLRRISKREVTLNDVMARLRDKVKADASATNFDRNTQFHRVLLP